MMVAIASDVFCFFRDAAERGGQQGEDAHRVHHRLPCTAENEHGCVRRSLICSIARSNRFLVHLRPVFYSSASALASVSVQQRGVDLFRLERRPAVADPQAR